MGLLSSCRQKRIDKYVSLWHADKRPYGTRYAHENLKYIFRKARIVTTSGMPYFSDDENSNPGTDSVQALIYIGDIFFPDSSEMIDLLKFASSGNQVFISANSFDDSILSGIHFKINYDYYRTDTMNFKIYQSSTNQWLAYNYPGFYENSYFDLIDTAHTTILGKNSNDKPNFIRLNFDHGGALFLHTAPIAFTNFFLLHRSNQLYYDLALSNISAKTNFIEWEDYFRLKKYNEFSSFHYILSQPPLKWAFWILIGIFAILLIFESKRKQRPMAEITPLRNTSKEFVKTVGRLYLQHRDNRNLAAKMIFAFLENIRVRYNIATNHLDEEFETKLIFRSGLPKHEITNLIQSIHNLQLKEELSDTEIMNLHDQINHFNKQA